MMWNKDRYNELASKTLYEVMLEGRHVPTPASIMPAVNTVVAHHQEMNALLMARVKELEKALNTLVYANNNYYADGPENATAICEAETVLKQQENL